MGGGTGIKIAFVTDVIYPFTYGGAEKRIYELSKRLVELGDEVTIIGLKWWRGPSSFKMKRVKVKGTAPAPNLYVRDRRSLGEPIYFAATLLYMCLKDLRKMHELDVIDCNEFPYLHCYTIRLLKTTARTKMIISWWEIWQDIWPKVLGKLALLGRIIERLMLRLPDAHITDSTFTRRILVSYGVEPTKIKVISSGVDISKILRIRPSEKKSDVIFVGRLIRNKRVDLLIRAIQYLVEDFPDIKVVIVGSGPEYRNLRRLVYELNLKKQIEFTGKLKSEEAVISLLKSSKVFVYPTAIEGGWSISALEASASGLPIVSVKQTPLGASTDNVINGYNGFLVEKEDPRLIADKIRVLLSDDNLREQMGRNALRFAQKFDWSVQVRRLRNFYKQVLEGNLP